MAAFSHQHMMTPFLFESSSAPLQNMPKNLNFPSGGLMEVEDHEGSMGNSNFFPSYNGDHQLGDGSQLDERSKTSLSVADDSMTKKRLLQSNNNVNDQSPTFLDRLESPTDKKRKNSSGSSLDSAQPKGGREGRSKKQKRGNGEVKEKESKDKSEKKDQKKVLDLDPPTGYIHVRARRGQATDSHSLAERVRREKISERMKTLQRLVPGCDKANGKALMLDGIINYVESLQNQVEFLSMKLASVNPSFYEFGMDLDSFMVLPERPSNMELSASLSPLKQCSPTQTTTFVDANTTAAAVSATSPMAAAFATAMSYPLMDSSMSLLLHGQRPIDFTQDTASLLWDLEEQRQKFHNPSWFSNNLSTFPLI